MASSDQWRWTDEDGVQRLLEANELRTALADGRLKPTTLVWRRGMKRWLPAASVPELAPQPGTATNPVARPSDLGPVAQATASIPPVAEQGAGAGRPMPQNLVDIDLLRKKSRRRRKDTMPGTGQHEVPESATEVKPPVQPEPELTTDGLNIPPPPRMPATASGAPPAEKAAPARRRRRKITRVGGPWSVRDSEDDTTTYVRDDLEKEKQKRDAAKKAAKEAQEAGPMGHRMPATSQPRVPASPSVPPLSPSVSPPAAGKSEKSAGRAKARTSRPPPPPRGRRDSRPSAGVAAKSSSGGAAKGASRPGRRRKRSIPPPAPKRSSAKSLPPQGKRGNRMFPPPDEPSVGKSPKPSKTAPVVKVGPSAAAAVPAGLDSEPDGAVTLNQSGKGAERVKTAATGKLPPTTELPAMEPPTGAGAAAVASVADESAPAVVAAPPAEPQPTPFEQPLQPRAATPAAATTSEPPAPTPAAAPADFAVDSPAVGSAPAVSGEPQAPPWAPSADPQAGPADGADPRGSWPRPPTPSRRTGLTVRSSVLIGAAAVVGLLLASSFLVGRLTAPAQSGLTEVVRARTGLVTVPLYARTPAPEASKPEPRPCLMKRAPARWAPAASKSIPFEMIATPSAKLAIGYAKSDKEVRGMVVDPDTGIIDTRYEQPKSAATLSRVVPVVEADQTAGFRATQATQAGVRNAVWVSAAKPFIVGFKDGECVALQEPAGEASQLWEVDTADGFPTALRALAVPGKGVALAYRHNKKSWYGWLDDDGKPVHPAKEFESSAVESGKPMVADNGEALSVVYAERPGKDQAAVIRWARAPIGQPLGEAVPLELPAGGPGGDAIAPAIAGLSGGRWLLMWTEGERKKQRVLRAQTYDGDGKPIGEALRVSPATGSFGQGTVGVKAESAAVVFLLVARRGYRRVYEIWGTVLQCQ